MLDELMIGGEIQETSKKHVLKAIQAQDLLQEVRECHSFISGVNICLLVLLLAFVSFFSLWARFTKKACEKLLYCDLSSILWLTGIHKRIHDYITLHMGTWGTVVSMQVAIPTHIL